MRPVLSEAGHPAEPWKPLGSFSPQQNWMAVVPQSPSAGVAGLSLHACLVGLAVEREAATDWEELFLRSREQCAGMGKCLLCSHRTASGILSLRRWLVSSLGLSGLAPQHHV